MCVCLCVDFVKRLRRKVKTNTHNFFSSARISHSLSHFIQPNLNWELYISCNWRKRKSVCTFLLLYTEFSAVHALHYDKTLKRRKKKYAEDLLHIAIIATVFRFDLICHVHENTCQTIVMYSIISIIIISYL